MNKEVIVTKLLKEIEECAKMIRWIEEESFKYKIDPLSNPVYNSIVARKLAFSDILNFIRSNNVGTFKY